MRTIHTSARGSYTDATARRPSAAMRYMAFPYGICPTQPGGAERVAWPFALELPVGDPTQFPIDQREQPVHRVGLAMTDLEKEVGDRLAIAIGRPFVGCHLAGCQAPF